MSKKEKVHKSYWTVIPAEVRYCKALGNASPRDLYGEISALCNERGYCWAGNNYFADLYDVDVRTVQRWLKLLEKHEFIFIVSGAQRKIYISRKFDNNTDNLEEPVVETEAGVAPAGKKSAPKKKAMKFEESDRFLAELMLQKVILNFPYIEDRFNKGKINLDEWADEIRKLREIDGATHEQIKFMITWVHGGEVENSNGRKHKFDSHDFWAKNILSASKLRKQWFENLIPQLQSELKKSKDKHDKTARKSMSVQM